MGKGMNEAMRAAETHCERAGESGEGSARGPGQRWGAEGFAQGSVAQRAQAGVRGRLISASLSKQKVKHLPKKNQP